MSLQEKGAEQKTWGIEEGFEQLQTRVLRLNQI